LDSHRVWRRGVFQTTTLLAVVLMILIFFVSAAYIFLLPAPEQLVNQEQLLDELQANRDKWASQRPVSFRYVVHRTCSCSRAALEPFLATEQRGFKTVSFAVPVESESGETLTSPPNPMWIENLFGLLDHSALDASKLVVAYDESFGFPSIIDIQHDAADDYIRYEVRDFEVLEYR